MRSWWSVFGRVPSASAVMAKFAEGLQPDSDRRQIARNLETVLSRALRRNVAVSLREELRETGDASSTGNDRGWRTDRRSIARELKAMRPEEEERVRKECGFSAGRVAALVPIHSGDGVRVATVVIGRRAVMPLSGRGRLLVAAVVGMASLLFEQNRLREDLRLAEAQAATLARLVKSRRQVAWTSPN